MYKSARRSRKADLGRAENIGVARVAWRFSQLRMWRLIQVGSRRRLISDFADHPESVSAGRDAVSSHVWLITRNPGQQGDTRRLSAHFADHPDFNHPSGKGRAVSLRVGLLTRIPFLHGKAGRSSTVTVLFLQAFTNSNDTRLICPGHTHFLAQTNRAYG